MDVRALLRDIGRQIAHHRARAGLTQEELAARLDVSVKYVQAVEGGRKNLSVRSLATFADAVQASVAALFEPPPSERPGRVRSRSRKP